MTLQTLSRVHAAHDIHRGEHTVVTHDCPGRIVDSHRSWAATTYTVEFAPGSKEHRRAGITLVGLTEGDVQPEADRPADDAGSRKIRREWRTNSHGAGTAEGSGGAQISPPEGAVASMNDYDDEVRALMAAFRAADTGRRASRRPSGMNAARSANPDSSRRQPPEPNRASEAASQVRITRDEQALRESRAPLLYILGASDEEPS